MVLVLIPLIILSGLTWASPAEDPEDQKSIPVLDRTQDFFGHRLNALANRIDSFFATERADDELGRSSIRIRQTYEIRERAIPVENRRYRINLRLPRLEEKFRYRFRPEKAKEDEKTITETEAEKVAKRNEVKKKWTFNADAGVSIAIPPRLTTRARVRRNFETGTFVHRFSEELTYVTDESGLTEETAFHSDHKISGTIMFRFINSKRWRVLRKEFVTNHGPTVLHPITENDGLSYNLIMANVIEEKVFFVTNYTFSINYRRNVYKNWVYLDVIPGIDFPKQGSFRRTPFALLQLEILFGR